jgi:hypothetical protein
VEDNFSLAEWAGAGQKTQIMPQNEQNATKEFSLQDFAGVPRQDAPQATLSQDLEGRAKEVGKRMRPEESEAAISGQEVAGGYNVLGQTAGAINDVMGHAVSAITPNIVKKGIQAVASAPMGTPETGEEQGVSIADAQKAFNDKFGELEKSHPELADYIKSTGNIAVLASMFYPGAKAGEALTPEALAKTAGRAATSVEKRLAGQVESEAIDVIKRDTSLMTKDQILKVSKAEPTALTKEGTKTVIRTTPRDIEMAKVVEDVVNPRNHFVDNVDAIRKKITAKAEDTEKMVKKYDQLYSPAELEPYLQAAKNDTSIMFAKEKTIENAYDSVIDKFKEILGKKDNTLSGALEARKELDKFIKSKFGDVFDRNAGDMPRANAIKDVRKAVNDYIADTLPAGDKFKGLLKEQSLMYDAIDRITLKQDFIDSSRFLRLKQIIKRHPWLAAEAVAGMAGGGLMSMGVGGTIVKVLTNPAILGIIGLYGGARIAGHYITARGLKSDLIDFLRTSERILKPQEKYQIQKIILQLPPGQGFEMQDLRRQYPPSLPPGTSARKKALPPPNFADATRAERERLTAIKALPPGQGFELGAPPSDMMRPPEAMLPTGEGAKTPTSLTVERPENFIPPEYGQRVEAREIPEVSAEGGAFTIRDESNLRENKRKIDKMFNKPMKPSRGII